MAQIGKDGFGGSHLGACLNDGLHGLRRFSLSSESRITQITQMAQIEYL